MDDQTTTTDHLGPKEVADLTEKAMDACNVAAAQLRGLGETAISMATTYRLQCQKAADDLVRRGQGIASNIRDFAQTITDQANSVHTMRNGIDAAAAAVKPAEADHYGKRGTASVSLDQMEKEIAVAAPKLKFLEAVAAPDTGFAVGSPVIVARQSTDASRLLPPDMVGGRGYIVRSRSDGLCEVRFSKNSYRHWVSVDMLDHEESRGHG